MLDVCAIFVPRFMFKLSQVSGERCRMKDTLEEWVIPLRFSDPHNTKNCKPSLCDFAPPLRILPIRLPLQAEVRAEELFLLDS
jgi:hypothetical protein